MASKNHHDKEMDFNKYKCSICSDIFQVPILTRCGHSFCNDCILTWLKDKKSCQVCQKELDPNGDIFPDRKMERIVSQLSVPCSNAKHGCLMKLSPGERKDHLNSCYYYISENSDECFPCNFSSIGCEKVFIEKSELEKHLKHSTQEHFHMVLEDHKNIKEQLNKTKDENSSLKMIMDEERRRKNFKIMELEDRLNQKLQLIKHNKPLNDKVNEYILERIVQLQDKENGSLIWVISDISSKTADMNIDFDSPEFFSSTKGYKFQLHMEIRKENIDHVGFFIRLLPSENDDQLQWPCNVLKYIVTIFHPDLIESKHLSRVVNDFKEYHIMRPAVTANTGLGYSKFITKQNLSNFVINNKLIVQTQVFLDN